MEMDDGSTADVLKARQSHQPVEDPSFHDTHEIITNEAGMQLMHGGLGFWRGEYQEGENSMDIYWGSELIGSVGLCQPNQTGAIIMCLVCVWNDGFTSTLPAAALYMHKHRAEVQNSATAAEEDAWIKEPSGNLQDVLATLGPVQCLEIHDKLLATYRDLEEIEPGLSELLGSEMWQSAIRYIEDVRLFTYADIASLVEAYEA